MKRYTLIEPGKSGMDDIVAAKSSRPKEDIAFGEDYEKHYRYDGVFTEVESADNFVPAGNDVVIGIDAGGTFTDAVVVALRECRVLAEGKAPTTHHDLAVGIREALLTLPERYRKEADRLAISTTLATNSIVEDKGSRTGLILIGYDEDVAARVTVGVGDIKAVVSGKHDVYGIEMEPLDEDGLLATAGSLIGKGMEAIAVSSYMGTRNPSHEIRAFALLRERFGVSVAMGHDLTDDIDSVRRAQTVLLNARLLPVIAMLIGSVHDVVGELGMTADIRLVTTDGSLMNSSEARDRPVRMILSGPAASVKGVRFLTDLQSCVIADMGGTTTDIAVIENGSARRTGRGAAVGTYATSIHATDIRTLGLGGDSVIAWERGNVRIGPRRAVPLCTLASGYPEVKGELARLKGFSASDYTLVQPGTFFVLSRMPENLSGFSERERDMLSILSRGPVSMVELARLLMYPYFSLLGTERLEELGFVRRSGLTPTDLMVAEGRLDRWDRDAARLGLDLYLERSGLPDWEFIRRVNAEVHRLAASSVISEVLSGDGAGNGSFPGCGFCARTFGEQNVPMSFTAHTDRTSDYLTVSYRLSRPLVGIGAPARLMLDGIGSHLAAEVVIPEWGEVANAVGAASGTGGMHIDMTIMPDGGGRFLLYSPEGMYVFRRLGDAKDEAVRLARECALRYAERMGYGRFGLDIRVRDRSALSAYAGDIYIDTGVVARMRY